MSSCTAPCLGLRSAHRTRHQRRGAFVGGRAAWPPQHTAQKEIAPRSQVAAQAGLLVVMQVVDEAPAWTLDQSVGLVFAFLLLGLYLSSSQLDKFVARSQRRQLGLCEECGGLYSPGSCTQKGCPLKGQQQLPAQEQQQQQPAE